jgi:hypothetical protein
MKRNESIFKAVAENNLGDVQTILSLEPCLIEEKNCLGQDLLRISYNRKNYRVMEYLLTRPYFQYQIKNPIFVRLDGALDMESLPILTLAINENCIEDISVLLAHGAVASTEENLFACRISDADYISNLGGESDDEEVVRTFSATSKKQEDGKLSSTLSDPTQYALPDYYRPEQDLLPRNIDFKSDSPASISAFGDA